MNGKSILEAEIVWIFLKAEIDSPSWSKEILPRLAQRGADRKIIDHPNLKSEPENEVRAEILGGYRGYGKNTALFQTFPCDMTWWRIQLGQTALEQIRYVNCAPWKEISGDSLLIADGAQRIRAGVAMSPEANKKIFHVRSTAKAIREGKPLPEVILVARSETHERRPIEGHTRTTAYLLEPLKAPISAILGLSENLSAWEQIWR